MDFYKFYHIIILLLITSKAILSRFRHNSGPGHRRGRAPGRSAGRQCAPPAPHTDRTTPPRSPRRAAAPPDAGILRPHSFMPAWKVLNVIFSHHHHHHHQHRQPPTASAPGTARRSRHVACGRGAALCCACTSLLSRMCVWAGGQAASRSCVLSGALVVILHPSSKTRCEDSRARPAAMPISPHHTPPPGAPCGTHAPRLALAYGVHGCGRGGARPTHDTTRNTWLAPLGVQLTAFARPFSFRR